MLESGEIALKELASSSLELGTQSELEFQKEKKQQQWAPTQEAVGGPSGLF